MSRFLPLGMENAFQRKGQLAVELIDSVTLERIYRGIDVTAHGLRGTPSINWSGLFVWCGQGDATIERITIDTRIRPFKSMDISKPFDPFQSKQPGILTFQLEPLACYPFFSGTTGLVGTLVESLDLDPEEKPEPVVGAKIQMQWMNNQVEVHWNESPCVTHSETNGAFAAVLRFRPNDDPKVKKPEDAPQTDESHYIVRLRVTRGMETKFSGQIDQPVGRVVYPHETSPQIFAWDRLIP